jgi:hypothetical protein
MRIKLTHDLSYLMGAWKFRRSREGIGVYGSHAFRSAFVAVALKTGFASPNRMQPKIDRVYFYNTALRAFMQKTIGRAEEAFCHQNEFASSYFAGLFDAVGYVQDGQAELGRMDRRDEMALLRLGYRVVVREGVAYIAPSGQFLRFIRNARRLEDSELERMPKRMRPNLKAKPPLDAKKEIAESKGKLMEEKDADARKEATRNTG